MFEHNPEYPIADASYVTSYDFDHILVNPEGRSVDIKNLYCHVPAKNGYWEYPTINVSGYGTVSQHRLVAKTFHECPGDPDKYHVNHLDGNKDNPSADNLEWTKYSENATHAYANGLRDDNIAVDLKDLITGAISKHYSLQHCARYLGINAGVISRHLKEPSGPLDGRYDIRYAGSTWNNYVKDDVTVNRSGYKGAAVFTDNETLLFGSVTAAATYLGIKPATLYYRLHRGINTFGGITVKFLDDVNVDDCKDAVYYRVKHNRTKPTRKPKPISVVDNDTGLVENWPSVEVFANHNGSKKNTVQRSMGKNKGNWRNYTITYIEDI